MSLLQVLWILLGIVVLVVVVMLNTVVVMWCERKWMGHLMTRMGPMATGWHGVLQPFADALKSLGKEDLTPSGADKLMFAIAPVLAFAPSLLIYASTPWVASFAGISLDAGIFMVFAVAALFPVGVLLGGWASHNKYSMMGGFRAAAQQISYEIPMILAALGVVMLASSTKLQTIVDAQAGLWNVVTQSFAFIIFFICVMAELNRTPFDLPEGESELVGGFNTEYSSMRFALFFVTEYANLFTWSLFTALLFFGGWGGPLLPGWIWLFLKTYAIVFVLIWVRATMPRVRVDQLMAFGWKVLLPAGLINVVITATGLMAGVWVLVVIELLAAAGFVWFVSRLGSDANAEARARAEAIVAQEVES